MVVIYVPINTICKTVNRYYKFGRSISLLYLQKRFYYSINPLEQNYRLQAQKQYMTTRRNRHLSQRNPTQLSKSGHIVEDNLERNNQMAQRYRSSVLDQIDRIDSTVVRPKKGQFINNQVKNKRQRMLSGQQAPYKQSVTLTSMNDYQKLLLGLEYSLQNERKKRETLELRNSSLETEIANLRNLLVGPGEKQHFQMAAFKEYHDKINSLEEKILEQKKNYQYIIDSKNEALASLELELRTVEKGGKGGQEGSVASRKLVQLMQQVQEQRQVILRKNITIERLRFHKAQEVDSESDQDQIERIAKKGNKVEFYAEQLQISNKLILRKNIEILNLNKKTLRTQEILDIMEQYLDKKEVRNVELSILEHPCVNKLRVLLREKAVFEREMLGQLNDHNKKISVFERQVADRDSATGQKVLELLNDNKRLTGLVTTLQQNIKNLEKSLEEERRTSDILRNQLEINKAKFVEEVQALKDELSTISSVTKNEFDRMKIQNLKLSEQNRSLLFLVGEKEKQLAHNGEALRSFQEYKEKINGLNVVGPQRRKVEGTAEENPQIGSKLLLIDKFSAWMLEWNKMRNWNNKKVLLNLILDKEQLRQDSLASMSYVVNILNEAFLQSKNGEVQERSTILLSHYIEHGILKNPSLFVNKLAPYVVRGLRGFIEEEDADRHTWLNAAAIKVISGMDGAGFRWSQDMTNEMLAVNGLKCLFGVIGQSQIDEQVGGAYNCLIMIAKANQMISFMNSFNVTKVLLDNLHKDYPFLIYALCLLKALLSSKDYIKSQKSLLQFRSIHPLLRDEDEEAVNLTLDCCLLLMDNVLYTKSVNKIELASMLAQTLRNIEGHAPLKKVGQVYSLLLGELESENVPKLNKQIDKLMNIVKARRYNQNRFNRAVRILLSVAQEVAENPDIDERIMGGIRQLYEHYDAMEARTRVKVNQTVEAIYERNKDVINKYSDDGWIVGLVEAYKATHANEELAFLLKLLMFQHEQKRTTEVLRTGREIFLTKLINDALIPDYAVALPALKNLLPIAKEKYAEKFMTKDHYSKLVQKVLRARMEQQYLSTTISILYFFSKNEDASEMAIEAGVVERVFSLIVEKWDKDTLVYRSLTLLELIHSTNYKRKILNHLLSSDPNLSILKTLSLSLKRAKNKKDLGNRAVFIYDFLNGKTASESLGMLIESNTWMVGDLIELRNAYVNVVDPLVYKIELLLHTISTHNSRVRAVYEKFKVEGDYDSEDDR